MTNLRAAIQKHPLVSYVVIAYAISWILTIPFILAEWGILQGDYRIAFVIKSFGPFAAALIVMGITEGKEGIDRLRGRIRQWKAGWVWYAVALLAIPVLFMAGLLIQPGAAAGFTGISPAVFIGYLVSFVIVAFGGGPLGEEPGWRGFALPRLQGTYGPLKGTLLLSLIWTCWHLPDFLTSAQGGGPGVPVETLLVNFVLFLLLVTSLSILFTWLFNHTGGSIFMAILAHASVNTPQVALVPLFPAVTVTMLNAGALIGFGIAAVLVLLITKGKFG